MPPKQIPGTRIRLIFRGWRGLLLLWGILLAWTHGLQLRNTLLPDDALLRTHDARSSAVFEKVQDEVRSRYSALYRAGQEVVAHASVVDAMRTPGLATEELFRVIQQTEVPERAWIEVYDDHRDLIAWSDVGSVRRLIPSDSVVGPTLEYVYDPEHLIGLVLRFPVLDAQRKVGTVQLVLPFALNVPLRTASLKPWNLLDTYLQSGVLMQWAPSGASDVRAVVTSGGMGLGAMRMEQPPVDVVRAEVRRTYIDAKAFFLVLTLATLLYGVWQAQRKLWLFRSQTGRTARRMAGIFLFLFSLATVRWVLLWADIPGRWQVRPAPLAPLFDPEHLASAYGGGLMQSAGDFMVSVVFGLGMALYGVQAAVRLGRSLVRRRPLRTRMHLDARAAIAGILGAMVTLLPAQVWMNVGRQAVLDSTLEFFSRSSLLPSPFMVSVFATLLVATVAALLFATLAAGWVQHLMCRPPAFRTRRTTTFWAFGVLGATIPVAVYLGIVREQPILPLIGFVALAQTLAWEQQRIGRRFLVQVVLRRVLVAIFVLVLLLYPVLLSGIEVQRKGRMEDAARIAGQSRDPRVLFALAELADRATRTTSELSETVIREMARQSGITPNASYVWDIRLMSSTGEVKVRMQEPEWNRDPSAVELRDLLSLLIAMWEEQGGEGALVVPLTGEREPDRRQYVGFQRVQEGWLMVRALPMGGVSEQDLPLSRLLLPQGARSGVHGSLAVAVFRDGALVRGFGLDFGRYRLDARVDSSLRGGTELWVRETTQGTPSHTLYVRESVAVFLEAGRPPTAPERVIAVRAPALTLFDHLFFSVRLLLAGLGLGLPIWIYAVAATRRHLRKRTFQDRVLNAFLMVGIVTVLAVAGVGSWLVERDTSRMVVEGLRQQLAHVEDVLRLEARPGELPYSVALRLPPDSLALRAGVDVNLYTREGLLASSRPAMVMYGIYPHRIPPEVFTSLVYMGNRFVDVERTVGPTTFTSGYRALADARGVPRVIVSLPILPNQSQFEEEQARRFAYLFGALLLLLLLVMTTAWILARRLSSPLADIRAGLEAVGQGRFETPLQVASEDELGAVARTFNAMQSQLAESRRQLAQQERQLAWREMARQVAHEIKNPLTPMKLSVQHLQRAFSDLEHDPSRFERFRSLFARITHTLIEQADALARIAGDFSTLARMPRRLVERLDLNHVARQAVSLMQEEPGAEIEFQPCAEPLPIQSDAEELRRVFINLIKNALQATPTDFKRVQVRVWRDGQRAVASVTDFGLGVPADLKERIFEPNFSTKSSGSGLGLSITRQAVEASGGEISFESEPGYTCFTLWMPLVLN